MKTYGIILLTLLAIFCSPDTTTCASAQHHPSDFNAQTIAKIKPTVAIASAYYKPVPGQKKYVTGSYHGDRRLNGTGITYSGKQAEIGDLAADLRYYPLGTTFRVFIDGKDFGIWTVEDKGEAIKGPQRFDFFLGENDAGRIAAQSWGRGDDHKIEMYRVGTAG